MGYRSIYDYDEELEHSATEWAKDKVKYIGKHVSSTGKTVYEYARNGAKSFRNGVGNGLTGYKGKHYNSNFGRLGNNIGLGLNAAGKTADNFKYGFTYGNRAPGERFTGSTAGRIGNAIGRGVGTARKAVGKAWTSARDFIADKITKPKNRMADKNARDKKELSRMRRGK